MMRAKRLVIKIGSTLLVDSMVGAIRQLWFDSLLSDVADCWRRGQEVIIVSSGSVALGKNKLSEASKKMALNELQAAAAVGQINLMHAYHRALSQHSIHTAQILLTLNDTESRRRYLNARNTLETLLRHRIIPVINENDTVATEEIRYGDNDRLAARVAQMVSADLLVLLSDVEGLYTADPNIDKQARLIPEICCIDAHVKSIAGGAASEYGSGGMATKVVAAEMVMSSGCHMLITSGLPEYPLSQAMNTCRGTWFVSHTNPDTAHKNWLAHHLKICGSIRIDAGAVQALRHGKSVLPVGITAVDRVFQKGDPIQILTPEGDEIGRGLVNYSAIEVQQLLGKQSTEIAAILGYVGNSAVVHRNNLVLTDRG